MEPLSCGHRVDRTRLPRRLLLSIPALALPSLARATEPIVIGGSGPVLAAARLLVADPAAQAPQPAEVLDSLGTRGGLQALRDGTIHIALFARPPTAEESAAGMMALPLGDSPLVAATRAGATPPAAITAAILCALMDGSQAQWPDGRPAVVIRRQAQEIDNAELSGVSPGLAAAVRAMLARSGPRTARTAQNNGEAIERDDGTLGFITLGQAMTEGRRIAPVPVRGLPDGEDWLVMKRFFVAHMADASPAVVALARRMAWAERGQRLAAHGFQAPPQAAPQASSPAGS